MENRDNSPDGKEEHETVLRLADDALVEAQNSIKTAREKLAIAQRNYEERMRKPRSYK